MIEGAYRLAGRLVEPLVARADPLPGLPIGRTLLVAASAGETNAARAFREATLRPGALIGTATEAGIAAGADLLLPRDLPRRTAELLERLKPRAVVLVEAELWPNLLRECRRRGIPTGCVGARMSPRAAARWARVPRSAGALLSRVSAFAAASSGDADRLVRAGAAPEAVRVCGWLKWPQPPGQDERRQRGREALELWRDRDGFPLLVLGSLHPGELTAAREALSGSALDPGRCRWLIVPRHAGALRPLRKEAEGAPPRSIEFEVRFGVLRSWYAVADAVLVGGGARGRGVHDLLEAVAVDRRPLFFSQRGDPADVGAVLTARGSAVPLDGPNPAVESALEPCPGEWAALRAARDGRVPAEDFLIERGVFSARAGSS